MKKSKLNLIVLPVALLTSVLILGSCKASSTPIKPSKSSVQKRIEPDTIKKSEPEKDIQKTFNPGSLIQAVSEGDIEKTKEILNSSDYQIDEINEKSETPLLIAVHNNQVAIAKLLIDAGANVNQQDTIQDSPYLYAGAEGRTEILSYILTHATPDQTVNNRYGGNALIPAAEKGHLENVKRLLADKRVAINYQNKFGYTALIEAVGLRDGSQVYQDIVAELLRNGANPNIRDNSGRTALDYANQLGYSNIANMIKAANAWAIPI
ncbi:MAG: ankyrin repeat domain-containing protein [Pseudolactococcus laudensis]